MEVKRVEAYDAANLAAQAYELGQQLADWWFKYGRVCVQLSTSDMAIVVDSLYQHGLLTDG